MFSFQRYKLLMAQIWERSPRWYLIVPSLAILAFFLIVYKIGGADNFMELYPETDRSFFRPSIMMNVFLCANTFSLCLLAAHLVGRHFKDNQQSVDSLTLPVSNNERFLGLATWVFLIIPLFGLLSTVVTFGLMKAVNMLGYFPRWSWMTSIFYVSILPYLVLAIPYFALGFIRPRYTLFWGLGIAGVITAFIGIVYSDTPPFLKSVQVSVSELTNLPDPATTYGPNLKEAYATSFYPDFSFASSTFSLLLTGLIPAILFFVSAWVALKNRQV